MNNLEGKERLALWIYRVCFPIIVSVLTAIAIVNSNNCSNVCNKQRTNNIQENNFENINE